MAETATEQPVAPEKATNGHAVENGTTDMSHYKMPDSKTLQEAGDLSIRDENNAEMKFSSLYTDKPGERQLICFIRHFYCGHCEEYVRYLSKHLPPPTLASTTPPTKLTIIGCGSTDNISAYRTRTGCPFPIYTDPTRNLYDKLGMVVTLGPGAESNKPEYLSVSVGQSVVSSFKNMIFGGAKGMKGGKFSQNGGEWIFEGGELKWVRRMRGTADHALVAELREVLGMSAEAKDGE